MKKFIGALTLVLVLAGCSTSAASEAAEADSQPAVQTASAAPKLPAVSLQTTCMLLFGTDLSGPVPVAADIVGKFVEAPDGSTLTIDEIETTIAALDTAKDRAEPALQPFIEDIRLPLQTLLESMTSQVEKVVSFGNYKASGIELINQCRPYL